MKYLLFTLALLLVVAFFEFAYHTAFTSPAHTALLDTMPDTLFFTSSAFAEGGSIPSQYTCDGTQVSPPLTIRGAPQGTKSLALIMEDPDVPKQLNPGGVFVHWVLFNIPPAVTEIIENGTVGTPGTNSSGKKGYASPCPPAQYEPAEHRYIFMLYALDIQLSLAAGATKDELVAAMTGHVLAQGQLMGRYRRR